MAWLLVDLHRGGVFWGDCSLANTLFRRDGDRIQAYLVDAETSEVHPELSDGQRAYDLEILVENVGYGLADLALLQGRPDDIDDAIEAAENVRERYEAIWRELHLEPSLPAGRPPRDPGPAAAAQRPRVRGRRDRGRPGRGRVGGAPARHDANREFHAHELERLTGIRALEGQARLLLNDLREHIAWLRLRSGRTTAGGGRRSQRWRREVLEPSLRLLRPAIGDRDPIQAYCDVLEHKWLLSERAGRDVGLEAAIEAYVAEGAPAPGAARRADLADRLSRRATS